ncbi:hypothetical protein Tco_1463032 [Tanacetum coccineum]
MAEEEINNLTIEQYLALTRGNQAPGMVKPEIGGNVNFKIKSQVMRELREDTFSGNKNDDAHEHVERILDIVSLFNILGVSHDAEPSILRISLKKSLSKGTARHPKPLNSLKKSGTSRLIPAMTPAQALTAIQTMADHSQKWHDGSSSRNMDSSSNSEGIAAIGAHLDKEYLLNEEVKSIEEVKYGEIGRSLPFSNGAKYH